MSHLNILENATSIQHEIGLKELRDKRKQNRILSIMPISHVNALITDIYIPLLNGCSVCFVDITETDFHLINSLKLARPLYFFASLVLLEIINDFISDDRIEKHKNISTRLFFENFSSVRQYRLRKLVGMDKCLQLFCIGGIISDYVFDSLAHLFLRIREVLGCNQTCGPHLWAKFNAEKGRLFNCHRNQQASIQIISKSFKPITSNR